MCGIAGAIRSLPASGDATLGLVRRINQAQRHRGPDGAGVWRSPGHEVVFGHRRLAILDLSPAGAQPMLDRDSGCAVTFNGEIYNFAQLRAELQAEGESFHSSCDTEVVLKAYTHWGIDAVRRFRGIFALALWDPRARAVHLVRDPMGIKPLYWTVLRDTDGGGEVVLFASELRALLATGAVARSLDPAAVASFLWQGFVVGPNTIVKGVQLLPGGTVLTLGPNARTLRRYWDLPPSGGRPAGPRELGDALRESVRMQLVSDVPLGVFLSGGIDSSAVAALASEARPDGLHTFTVGFDSAAHDESAHAERVASAIGSRHTRCLLREQEFLEQLPDAFQAIDQPTFDGINTYFVSRAAREAGMTVALAGTGGDEVFGGYPSFARIPKLMRATAWLGQRGLRRAWDGSLGAGSRLASRLAWDVLGVAPPQTRWGKLADVARAAPDALGLYQVAYALFTRETQALLAADAVRDAQRSQPHGLPPSVDAAWRARIHGSEPRHAVSVLELSSFVGERLLRDTDAASMAVGLEVRVPLLDHVLAETAAAVDPARRFSPPGKKLLLRELALGKLDPALFERPKSGFVLPIDRWARQRLQPRMQAAFEDPWLARRAGLSGEAVRTLWRSFSAGRPGLYWSRVWALYVLLSWCESHDVGLAA
jgi:asparagine synthase (glutamine-hydrolysing)